MLIEKRREIKNQMKNVEFGSPEYILLNVRQETLKVLTNSFYGYTGWNMARWYCRECAEATTAWGRHFIKTSARIAEEMGFNVLYGDTDSIFVKKDSVSLDEMKKEVRRLIKRLSKELPIQIEVDEYYRTIFFVEKKRYAGYTEEGRFVIRGLEVRRGDWCELAKKVQKSVIETILRDKNPEKAAEIVKDVIEGIRAGEFDLEEYIIYKSLTRRPARYESVQAHVKAAMKAEKKGIHYPVGSKVGYIVVKGTGNVGDRAFPSDLIEKFDGEKIVDSDGEVYRLDKEYYINNQIVPSIMRILERFGFTDSLILGKAEQKTLDKFF
jgi:DNA polymerase I